MPSYHDALLDAQARKLLRLSPAMRTKLVDRFYEGDDDRKKKMVDRIDELESGDDPKSYRNPGELLTELETMDTEEPGAVPAATGAGATKPTAVKKADDARRAKLRKAVGGDMLCSTQTASDRKVTDADADSPAAKPKSVTRDLKRKKRMAANSVIKASRRPLGEGAGDGLDELVKRGNSEGARKGWITRKGGGGGRGKPASNMSRQVPRASALDGATGRKPRSKATSRVQQQAIDRTRQLHNRGVEVEERAMSAAPKVDRRKAENMSLKDISNDFVAARDKKLGEAKAKNKVARRAGKAKRARIDRTSTAYKNALGRIKAKRGHSKDRDGDRVTDDYRGNSKRGKVRVPATRRALLGS